MKAMARFIKQSIGASQIRVISAARVLVKRNPADRLLTMATALTIGWTMGLRVGSGKRFIQATPSQNKNPGNTICPTTPSTRTVESGAPSSHRFLLPVMENVGKC